MSFPLKRIIKYIAVATAGLAGIFLVLAVIIGVFYGKEIKALILKKINENMATELTVGDVDFSLLRHFPYATVQLQDVMMKSVGRNDTLLATKELSCLLNLSQVFSKNVNIRKIILADGKLNVYIDKDGKNNYHFWKDKPASDSSKTESDINLQQIFLRNVDIQYRNLHDNQQYVLKANEAELNGEISGSQIRLKTQADMFVDQLINDGVNYISRQKVNLSSVLLIDNEKESYAFSKTKLSIGGVEIDAKGTVEAVAVKDKRGGKTSKVEIFAEAPQSDLQKLLSILPINKKLFTEVKSRGKVKCNMTVTGFAGHGKSPELKVTFSLNNGSMVLRNKIDNVELEKLDLNGTYVLSGKHDELLIPSFKGELRGKDFSGDMKLTDLSNPFLAMHAKADIDLKSLRPFIGNDTLEKLSGNMKVDIAFAGKVKELKENASKANYKSSGTGNVTLTDVAFRLKRNPLDFKNINAQLSLHDNNIDVSSLDADISSTDIHLKGVFRNFITFILIPHQEADIDASIQSSFVDLDELLEKKSSSSSDETYKLKFNPRLKCRLQVAVDKLRFRRFNATEMRGTINVDNETVSSNNLAFNSVNGNVMMSASINTSADNYIGMNCRAKLSGLDISKLFYEMEDFSQNTLTHKNLEGSVTADVSFNSTWSPQLVINPSSVTAKADLRIDNGELNDFKPVLALSKYLKLADLKHIKFSTLQNTVTIGERKIFIPSMNIQSNALNLTVSGVHDFDNMTDYKLKMLLSDVLGKKIKKQESEFGEIEDDGLGHPQLFLTMKGPADDPKFAYDKQAVAQKFKNDVKKDRQNIKQMLKEEFSLSRDDKPKEQSKKKKEEMQIDWDN